MSPHILFDGGILQLDGVEHPQELLQTEQSVRLDLLRARHDGHASYAQSRFPQQRRVGALFDSKHQAFGFVTHALFRPEIEPNRIKLIRTQC